MATRQRDQLITAIRALQFDGPGQPTSAQVAAYLNYIRTQDEGVCRDIATNSRCIIYLLG